MLPRLHDLSVCDNQLRAISGLEGSSATGSAGTGGTSSSTSGSTNGFSAVQASSSSKLYRLALNVNRIAHLQGLNACTNLHVLELANNEIERIDADALRYSVLQCLRETDKFSS